MKHLIFALLASLVLSLSLIFPALADDPIIGEIRIWPAATPPPGWLICNGARLSWDTYPDLYAVIGLSYGGVGVDHFFDLPNLKGRVPVGYNSVQTEFDTLGETGGEISHTLTINEIPSHRHTASQLINGAGSVQLVTQAGAAAISSTTNATGGGLPHNNLQPYLALNYIIYTGVGGPTPTPTPTPTATPTATPAATPGCTSAFPSTAILDDFNRDDGGLGASWTTMEGSPVIDGNEVSNTHLSDPGSAYWDVSTIGPDSEVFATFPIQQNGGTNGLWARMSADLSEAYFLESYRDDVNGDTVVLNSTVNASISVTSIDLSDGDSFGLRLVGDQISIWYKPVGGSWTLLDTVTNSDVPNGGYIGFWLNDTTARMDDFGGGDYVPGSCSNTYLPLIITTTLKSGTVLSIPEQVSFGQIIVSGIVVSLLAAFALDFIFRLVYRR